MVKVHRNGLTKPCERREIMLFGYLRQYWHRTCTFYESHWFLKLGSKWSCCHWRWWAKRSSSEREWRPHGPADMAPVYRIGALSAKINGKTIAHLKLKRNVKKRNGKLIDTVSEIRGMGNVPRCSLRWLFKMFYSWGLWCYYFGREHTWHPTMLIHICAMIFGYTC